MSGVLGEKKMTQRFLSLSICLLIMTTLLGQNGQIVRGVLKDQVSHAPISYANVIIADSIITSTDENGRFKFEDINVGVYPLIVSYIGYDDLYMPNVIVDAGKETVVDLFMIESIEALDAVVVKASRDKTKPINEMSLLSTRMVGVEETKRYASSFNDPARMANSFAGVVQTDAGNNNIAIRGNSPNGLLWRLEGVEIPNPNHFSAVGTSGGGVSILSGQLLANSDFSTGAFAAEYGNALSGVFDIKLRKGNNQKREYTVQAGVLGIDLAAEGPFSKNSNSSYLVNYRYSTLGILSQTIDLGGFVTTFQDLSYNISFDDKKFGNFTFFGLNGLSNQTGYDSIELYELDFVSNTLVNGVTHGKSIGKNSYIKSAVVYSQRKNSIEAIKSEEESGEEYTALDESHKTNKLTISSRYQHKIDARTSLKFGAIHSLTWYDEYKQYQQNYFTDPELYYNQDGNTAYSQLYGQVLHKFSKQFTSSLGFHSTYNWLNDTKSLEPRLGLKYALNPKHALSLGYGMHSQILPLGIYFVEIEDNEGQLNQPNLNLEMLKAHHFIVGYNFKISPLINVKLEGYYQSIYDVPRGLIDEENESLLNNESGTIDEALTNDGKGRNYGVEFTVERYLKKGFYFTSTSSIYSSEFKGNDKKWYDTRYNGGFTNSVTTGKEFTISKRKKRSMGIHIKSIFSGGLRQSPVDVEQSILKNETVYDNSNPFSVQLPNYFRFDFKLSFKRNFKNITSTLIFDIQNVTNRKNVFGDRFNPSTGKVERFDQVGLLPIIAYKIEF